MCRSSLNRCLMRGKCKQRIRHISLSRRKDLVGAWAWLLRRWWPSATLVMLERWFWWTLAMVPFCLVVFQLVIGLTLSQANRVQHGIRPCILCLVLDCGLLAYLPFCVNHQHCQGHGDGVRCRRLRRGAPPDGVFPRHVVESNSLFLLSASRLRHAG